MRRPRLSIVVVAFDMERELPRTVQSLLPPYQIGIEDQDIEIIVVDNGSGRPVSLTDLPLSPIIRLIRWDDSSVSPCAAITAGVAEAQGEWIAIMVDGARLVTPGIVRASLDVLAARPKGFVATLGFHLGPKVQQISVEEGYDRDAEDGLLAGIDWPSDGYRLFEIGALGESYRRGIITAPYETTYFAMSRARFQAIGGYDYRFRSLGGGLAGFDVFERIMTEPDAELIMLLGEATFHQLHFGATTRKGGVGRPIKPDGPSLWEVYNREYEAIRGQPYQHPNPTVVVYGRFTHPQVQALFFPVEAE